MLSAATPSKALRVKLSFLPPTFTAWQCWYVVEDWSASTTIVQHIMNGLARTFPRLQDQPFELMYESCALLPQCLLAPVLSCVEGGEGYGNVVLEVNGRPLPEELFTRKRSARGSAKSENADDDDEETNVKSAKRTQTHRDTGTVAPFSLNGSAPIAAESSHIMDKSKTLKSKKNSADRKAAEREEAIPKEEPPQAAPTPPPSQPPSPPVIIRTQVRLFDDYDGISHKRQMPQETVDRTCNETSSPFPPQDDDQPTSDSGLTWRQRKRLRRKQNQLAKSAADLITTPSIQTGDDIKVKDQPLPVVLEETESAEPITVDYTTCTKCITLPPVGCKIAYKILEMSSSYCPEISEYKEAVVMAVEYPSSLTLQPSDHDSNSTAPEKVEDDQGYVEYGEGYCKIRGKFELPSDDEYVQADDESNAISLSFADLIDPVIISI